MKVQQIAAATILVLLLLTFAAEAHTCKSRSRHFNRRCFKDTDCAAVCDTKKKGHGGYCHGAPPFKVCMCTKPCKNEVADVARLRSAGL